jgi:hypothetical protein
MGATPDMTPQRLWIMGTDENGNAQPPFEFDAVISEGHSSKLSIMENPVETGVVVADHAFMLPRELEIQAVVSDVWLGMRGDQQDRDKIGPLARDRDWLIPSEGGDTSRRDQRAFQSMLGLQASASPFNVQTGLRMYFNMLIVELSANQDKRTASALIFTAKLREVLIVSTKTIKYPPRADKKTSIKADKKTTSGDKSAVAPPESKRASVALQGLRATGVLH